jgi:hypothetical protein
MDLVSKTFNNALLEYYYNRAILIISHPPLNFAVTGGFSIVYTLVNGRAAACGSTLLGQYDSTKMVRMIQDLAIVISDHCF